MRVTAARLAAIEDRAAAILGAAGTAVLFGAEAELPLEAVTASLGGPMFDWLNVVTSPYGRQFGALLRSRGTTVHDLVPPNDRPVRVEEVAEALARYPAVGALSIVHAESLTGVLNPLPEVMEVAVARGLLTVVDAVASAGAEPLDVGALGIDVCVVGPQKGWAGPAGASIATISDRAWSAIAGNPTAARGSVLSLLDIKETWIDTGRSRVRGTPPPLEIEAMDRALDLLEAEGIEQVVRRHAIAAAATRAGVRALGLSAWVQNEVDACSVATPARMPPGVSSEVVVELAEARYGVELTPGSGALAEIAVRFDHMGDAASFPYVATSVAAVGAVLLELGFGADVAAAQMAVVETFADERVSNPAKRSFAMGPKTAASRLGTL